MADTSHIGPIPDKAYTAEGSGETHVKSLQSMTETSVRQTIRGPVDQAFGFSRNSLLEQIVGGIGQAISDGLNGIFGGIFAPVNQAMKPVRDGQQDLEGRTDLLSPLLDYRSVSTAPTGADAMKGTGQMPFNFQIGPFRGVGKKSNTLVLDGPGLWDLRAQVTASWTANPFGKKLQVYLRVLRPDGSIFSEQAHYAETQNSITIPVVSSVCVPTAGYQVDVWVYAQDGNRGWWSGPKWTRLTAQHISRTVENGTGGETSTTPTDNPEEG